MRTIPAKESLTVEFKSDRRRLPDEDLVTTVVCLANSEGGDIYVGVEDDGRITGLHPAHRNAGVLAAMIANRTNPPVSVRVTTLREEGSDIVRIEVPKSVRIIATSDGLLQRRRMQVDGTPQCVPLYPHEVISRQADLGILDYSAMLVTGASEADFDPLERERLRQLIERYGGDQSLIALSDEELEGASLKPGLSKPTASRRGAPTPSAREYTVKLENPRRTFARLVSISFSKSTWCCGMCESMGASRAAM